MSCIAAISTRIPCSGCDVGRIVGAGQDSITYARQPAWKQSGVTTSDTDVAEVADYFTAIKPIGYEGVGINNHVLGGPTAVSAMTILEGPVSGG